VYLECFAKTFLLRPANLCKRFKIIAFPNRDQTGLAVESKLGMIPQPDQAFTFFLF
jgi:hypothetical protein